MYECMNGAMNSENMDARIMGNRALDQNIWAFEVLGVKQSLQEVLGQFWNFWSGRGGGGYSRKRQGLMQNLGKF
jgi:hypothetical protein